MAAQKILFSIGSLELGGTESQMALLIRGLMQRNYHFELFALEAKGPVRRILEREGISIHDGAATPKPARRLRFCCCAQLRL